jgi:integrase
MTPEKPEDAPITKADLAALAALIPRPMPWAAFKTEVRPALSPPLISKGQASRYVQIIRELEAIDLADEGDEPRFIATTADLNLTLVTRFCAARPPDQSPSTLRSLLLCVAKLCNMAVERRLLTVSPFVTVPIRRLVGRIGKPQGKRHLTKDECRRLLALLRQDVEERQGWSQWKARRLLVVACLGLYCGLRKMEMLMLHVADIDWEARVIRLVPHNEEGKFKTLGSEQPVPMPGAMIAALKEWLDHRMDRPPGYPVPADCPWLVPTCDRKHPWISGSEGGKPLHRLQAAAFRAGIEYVTLHELRRSLATHLEAHPGVNGALISRVLRHADEKTTETFYRRADEANLADAVADFDF